MSSTTLHQLIQTEFDLMQQFFFSLEKENELLLSSYSNDDLYDLTELKNHYADQLAHAATERDAALSSLGLSTGRDGLIAAQALSEPLHGLVQSLFDLAEKARLLNEENGLLIHTYLEYSVQALEALGQANPANNEVYDAKGKTYAATRLKRGIVRV
ncbi:MAG: flagellar protein FlgN [Alcaligenaceae bacterium]|nr:flagellar protein FlgN [Alcaligenaceae bacterium]